MTFFSLKSYLSIPYFVFQIQDQDPKIDPCAKFQPNWTKDKGARISKSSNTENCLMMSHTHDSEEIIKIFNAFERFCSRVPSYQVWW